MIIEDTSSASTSSGGLPIIAIAAGAGGGALILFVIIIIMIRLRRNANVRLTQTAVPNTSTPPSLLEPNTSSSALVSSNSTSDVQFRNKGPSVAYEIPQTQPPQWSGEYALQQLPMRRATIGWGDTYALQPAQPAHSTQATTHPTYEGINDDPSATYEYISDGHKNRFKSSSAAAATSAMHTTPKVSKHTMMLYLTPNHFRLLILLSTNVVGQSTLKTPRSPLEKPK